MKKLLKTLNFTLILIVIFSTLTFLSGESAAFATQNTVVQAPVKKEQVTSDAKNTKEAETIPEKNGHTLTHMPKSGFKYAIFKFFLAMIGVLVSALAIFAGLKIYQKFVLKNNLKLDKIDYDKTLESPKDFKEVINLFLDKTDK